jgi:transcriptional regulator with XRE-family HTH domain
MLFPIKNNLIQKLKDRTYRHKFFRGRAEDEVAAQLQEFRKKRDLTQDALAGQCGMKQSAISRIEKASYSKWSFSTLWRLAEALDVRIRVVIEDMDDVIRDYEARENQAHAVIAGPGQSTKTLDYDFENVVSGAFKPMEAVTIGYRDKTVAPHVPLPN